MWTMFFNSISDVFLVNIQDFPTAYTQVYWNNSTNMHIPKRSPWIFIESSKSFDVVFPKWGSQKDTSHNLKEFKATCGLILITP